MGFIKSMKLAGLVGETNAYCKVKKGEHISLPNGQKRIIVLCYHSQAARLEDESGNVLKRFTLDCDPDFTGCKITREVRVKQPDLITYTTDAEGNQVQTVTPQADLVTYVECWDYEKAAYKGIKKLAGYENTEEI